MILTFFNDCAVIALRGPGRQRGVPEEVGLAGEKILLLSQDVNVGVVAVRFLNRRGFVVSSVMDEQQALGVCTAQRPDLIVLDDLGSVQRCLTFLKRLNQLGPPVPPVLMAGLIRAEAGVEDEAKRLGVAAFLFEPFRDLPGLADAISAHIERAASKRGGEGDLRDSGRYSSPPREERSSRPSSGGLSRPVTAAGSGQRGLRDSGRYSSPPREERSSRPPPTRRSRPVTAAGSGQRGDRPSDPAAGAEGVSRFKETLRYGGELPDREDTGPADGKKRRFKETLRYGKELPDQPSRSRSSPGGPPPKAERLEYRRPPLPEMGSLAEQAFPELLHLCAIDSFCGMLMVRRSPVEKGIFFQNGKVVFVESDVQDERLGTYLRRIGRLSEEDYVQVEQEMKSSGRKMGDILVARSLIDPNELFELLTEHITEKLISCFAWQDGVFALEAGNRPSDAVVPLRLDTPRMILDGINRHYDQALLEHILRIPDQTYCYIRQDSPLPEHKLSLNTREARLYDLARRGETLGNIIRYASGRSVEVLRLLYALYIMEAIGFTLTPPKPAAASAVGSVSIQTSAKEEEGGAPPDSEASGATKPPDSGIMLLEELAELEGADYFQLHGLGRDATTDGIHKAFRARAKRYHPDKLQKYPTEVQKKGAEVYRALVKGYRVLADPRKRAQYLRDLEDPKKVREMVDAEQRAQEAEREEADTIEVQKDRPKDKPAPPKPPPEQKKSPAEEKFDEARTALRGERIEDGLAKLKELHEDRPDNPRFEAWLGWALYLSRPDKARKTAEKHLAVARRNNPKLPDPFLLMARICEREGLDDQAKEYYGKAVELAPEDLDIARESRLFDIRLRKGKTRRRPGAPGDLASAEGKSESSSGLNQDVGVILKKLFSRKK